MSNSVQVLYLKLIGQDRGERIKGPVAAEGSQPQYALSAGLAAHLFMSFTRRCILMPEISAC